MKYSKRIEDLPPYLFAEIDRRKKAAIERGVDIILSAWAIPTCRRRLSSSRPARRRSRTPATINIPLARGF